MAVWPTAGRPARSTANGQKCDRWAAAVDRSGRPKIPESRALNSVDRSGRPTTCVASVHDCAHRSTDPVDRPLGAVDRSGRPNWPGRHSAGSEKQCKIFSKNLLTLLKNSQNLFYHFILKHTPVIKISRQYINISIYFCVLQILSKTKLVFLSNLIFPKHE